MLGACLICRGTSSACLWAPLGPLGSLWAPSGPPLALLWPPSLRAPLSSLWAPSGPPLGPGPGARKWGIGARKIKERGRNSLPNPGRIKFWRGICVKLWPIPFGVNMRYLGTNMGHWGTNMGALGPKWRALGPWLVILMYTGQLINIYWPVSPYTTPSFAKKPAPGAARALPRPQGAAPHRSRARYC